MPHLWNERGRPTDLLWTGASFTEYSVWRTRYSGRLTALEQSFGAAMEGDEALAGPVNVTAPEPVTNRELSRTLGRVLRRPAFAPVPALAVKALYGEMATIVTTGQRVVPGRLMELGYEFRRPDLEEALRSATR